MAGMIVAPQIRDLPVLARQLAEWIAPHMPEARNIQALNLAYPFGAGLSRTLLASYLPAFFIAGALCIIASLLTLAIARQPKPAVATA